MPISIIVPTLNDAATLDDALQALQPLRSRGNEVLVVDGGSRDGSVTIARRYADRVLMSGSGRALQMNSATEYASHEIFVFLPLDARLPDDADVLIEQALQPGVKWGYFERSAPGLAAFPAAWSNWRADATGLASTGHGIFVIRTEFERVKGFDMVTEQEGEALSRKLHQLGKPACIKTRVRSLGR